MKNGSFPPSYFLTGPTASGPHCAVVLVMGSPAAMTGWRGLRMDEQSLPVPKTGQSERGPISAIWKRLPDSRSALPDPGMITSGRA
ncbi:hypothetical protein CHELA40_30093 [Chelatococcus asaccharovorans]|nr:hypothetical protein CHELA17_40322 [Chelatococcus asaccharovorans]CAH1687879.1 hypothetical protein CHELA40_30093 [Chelatococcus asaccharovorans]